LACEIPKILAFGAESIGFGAEPLSLKTDPLFLSIESGAVP
jgi:hypothetical protein